jgi:hypothetical protein
MLNMAKWIMWRVAPNEPVIGFDTILVFRPIRKVNSTKLAY